MFTDRSRTGCTSGGPESTYTQFQNNQWKSTPCCWQWVGCLLVASQVGGGCHHPCGGQIRTFIHGLSVKCCHHWREAALHSCTMLCILKLTDPFTYRELSDCSSHWLKVWIHIILLFFCFQRRTWLFKYSHKVASKSSLRRFCFC